VKHHILVKWNESVDKQELVKQAKTLFSQLNGMKGIHDVQVLPNCIDRPNRYDLLILIDMDKEALESYDASAAHKQWKADFSSMIQSKAIFDCE